MIIASRLTINNRVMYCILQYINLAHEVTNKNDLLINVLKKREYYVYCIYVSYLRTRILIAEIAGQCSGDKSSDCSDYLSSKKPPLAV